MRELLLASIVVSGLLTMIALVMQAWDWVVIYFLAGLFSAITYKHEKVLASHDEGEEE